MTALCGFLPANNHLTTCFSVVSAAEPGALPRVLEIFAKRGLVPSKLLSAIAGNRGEELHIDIQIVDVDGDLMARLMKSISPVVSVRSVLTSEKRRLMSA